MSRPRTPGGAHPGAGLGGGALLAPHPPGVPEPTPSRWSQPYWEGLRAGELRFQRCRHCKEITHNPAPVCAHCLSEDLDWEVSAGRGTIYSYTTVWRPQTPAFRVPYCAAIVDVDEGFQMLANVIGCPPGDVHIGMRVTFESHPISERFWLPYFRPAAGGTAGPDRAVSPQEGA